MANPIMLKKIDGIPTIEVVVGQAHFGHYVIKLFDSNNQNPKTIGEGFSGDQIDDVYEIGDITTLNNRFLTFEVRTASLSPSNYDTYSISILIKQRNKTVPGGLFTFNGPLTEDAPVKTIADFVLLKVSA